MTTQPKVFVSYSNKDEQEKEALLAHLKVLELGAGLIKPWSADQIAPGDDVEEEVMRAIAEAQVALLLISANFLTTDFTVKREVPELLKRRKNEGLRVIPVIAKACAWEKIGWLQDMSVRPKLGKPIWRDQGLHVDEELTRIVNEVADVLNIEPQGEGKEKAESTATTIPSSSKDKVVTLETQTEPLFIEASIFHDKSMGYVARFQSSVGTEVMSFTPPGSGLMAAEIRELREGISRSISRPDFRATEGINRPQDIGERLFNSLFSGKALNLYQQCRLQLENSEQLEQRLVIKINPTTYELANLPWELLYDPKNGFLAFDRRTPIIRFNPDARQRRTMPDTDWRILLVASNPAGTTPLDLLYEMRQIQAAFKESAPYINLNIEKLPAPSAKDLRGKLREFDPHILHFMGHGGAGRLLLDAPGHGVATLRDSNLALILQNIPALRLVFLNACESGAAESEENLGIAYALSRIGIPAVVANQFPARDDAASEVSEEFYRVLSSGLGVDESLLWSRIALQGFRETASPTLEWATPILYLQAANGYLFKDLLDYQKSIQAQVRSASEQTSTIEAAPETIIFRDADRQSQQVLAQRKEIHQRNLDRLLRQQQKLAEAEQEAPAHIGEQIQEEEEAIRKIETILDEFRRETETVSPDSSGLIVPTPISDDEEQQLEAWYEAAVQAMTSENWSEATRLLEQVISLNDRYKDASQRLQTASHQSYLAALYKQGILAYEKGDWTVAIDYFQNIQKQQSAYGDVSDKLGQAKQQLRLERLHNEGVTYIDNEKWDNAVEVLSQIEADAEQRPGLLRDLNYARALQTFERVMQRVQIADDRRTDWEFVIKLLQPIVGSQSNYRKAASTLNQSQKSLDWLTRYQKGQQHLQAENWNEAIQIFESILRENENYRDVAQQLEIARRQQHLKVNYEQGKAYVDRKVWSEARSNLRTVIDLDPSYRDASVLLEKVERQIELAGLYSQAQQNYDNNALEAAITLLSQIVTQEPAYAEGKAKTLLIKWQEERKLHEIYEPAMTHVKNREWQAAVAAFEQLHDIAPDGYRNSNLEIQKARRELQLETLYDNADTLFKEEKWEQAIAAFEGLQELGTEDYRDVPERITQAKTKLLEELYQTAYQYQRKEQWAEAIEVLEQIRQRKLDDASVEEQLKEARRQQQLADWYAKAKQAASAENWADAVEYFGKIKAAGGINYKDTLRQYGQVEHNLKVEKLYQQATAALENADMKTAEDALLELLSINSDYQDASQLLSDIRRQMRIDELYAQAQAAFAAGKWNEAADTYRQVVDLDDQYKDAAQKLKRAEQAQELASLYEAAEHAEAQEQWQQALENYEAILAKDDAYRDVEARAANIRQQRQIHNLYKMARQSEDKGHSRQALEQYQAILELDRNFSDVRERVNILVKSLELDELYKTAKEHLRESRYADAIPLLESLRESQVDYEDTTQLLEQAKTQAHLTSLSKQAELAYQDHNWDEAIARFEEIRAIDPDYKNVAQRLQDARQEQEWDRMYDEGLACITQQNWGKAVEILSQTKANDRHRREHSQELAYAQAMQAFAVARKGLRSGQDTQENWQQVLDLLASLVQEHPDHRDASKVMQAARNYLKWNELYRQGQQAAGSENWSEAIQQFEAIVEDTHEYRDAVEQLEQARRQQELAEHYQRTRQYVQWQSWRDALKELKAIANLDPHYRDTSTLLDRVEMEIRLLELFSQAMQSYGANDRQAAITHLHKVTELAPNYRQGEAQTLLKTWQKERDIRQAYEAGMKHIEARQWQAAVDKLAAVIALEPKGFLDTAIQLEQARFEVRLETLYTQAKELMEQQLWEEASSKLKELQTLQADYRDVAALINRVEEEMWLAAQYNQAQQYQGTGEWDKAITILEGIQQRKSEDAAIKQELQAVRRQKLLVGWYREAQQAFQAEDWTMALNALEQIQEMGEADYQDVQLLYQRAKHNQRLVELYDEAEKALDGSDLETAIKIFEDILKEEPNFRDVHLKLIETNRKHHLIELNREVEAAFEARQWEKAIATLKQMIDIDPDFEDAAKRLQEAQQLKKLDRFYRDAEQAMSEEQWQKAVDRYGEIVALDKNYLDAQDKLAQAKRFQQIHISYQRAVEYESGGDLANALEQYQAVFNLDPHFENVATKVKELTQVVKLSRLYEQALAALKEQNFREGIVLLQQLVDQELGYKDAEDRLQKAIENHYEALMTRFQYAQQLEKEGRIKEARREFEAFQDEKDNSPWFQS